MEKLYRQVCIVTREKSNEKSAKLSEKSKAAREQILATAARLFYTQGYHAIGVDTIAAESGLSKMTLYRYFPSKDALIAAYLQQANTEFWTWFDGAVAVGNYKAQLVALFEAATYLTATPQCLGCTFQMAAGEFPDPTHPAHEVALEHKRALIARLTEMATGAGVKNPVALANQLFLLMDGVWAARRMFGPDSPAGDAVAAARALIAAG